MSAAAGPPTTEAIVSFLRRPESYPDGTRQVDVVETHMSWVFLTRADVYKLKKAIRLDGLDFSTPELRRRNCLEEVRLNRRLARDVYRGVVAVTRSDGGRLAIDGSGPPVDWLVRMRRLPPDGHLEGVLRSGRTAAAEAAIREAAGVLARFYAAATPVALPADTHLDRLRAGVEADRAALTLPRYRLPAARVDSLAASLLVLLDRCRATFRHRVEAGHIVEGHGDLRPEHIWLGPPPVFIDCIEFDPELRIVDPVDDLSFLALECERLGDERVGRWFFDVYAHVTGDVPPPAVSGFYRVYRALRRAAIAARHLDDPAVPDPGRFLDRALAYIEMVEPVRPEAA